MKKSIFSFALLVSVIAFFTCSGGNAIKQSQEGEQIAQLQETSFKVYGVCGMCKNRIEKAANAVDGVQSAEWDQENNILSFSYDENKVKLDDVHKKIAAVGHDTEKEKATDDVYNALPACCQYERQDM